MGVDVWVGVGDRYALDPEYVGLAQSFVRGATEVTDVEPLPGRLFAITLIAGSCAITLYTAKLSLELATEQENLEEEPLELKEEIQKPEDK